LISASENSDVQLIEKYAIFACAKRFKSLLAYIDWLHCSSSQADTEALESLEATVATCMGFLDGLPGVGLENAAED
jgi:hypothetical protein